VRFAKDILFGQDGRACGAIEQWPGGIGDSAVCRSLAENLARRLGEANRNAIDWHG